MKKLSLLCLTILASPSLAAVNPVEGLYAGLSFGGAYTFATNDVPIPTVPGLTAAASTAELTHKLGGNVGLSVGYRFNRMLRAEGELFFTSVKPDKLTFADGTVVPSGTWSLGGYTTSYGGLINGFIDFLPDNSAESGKMAPYIGLGLGAAQVQTQLAFNQNNVLVLHTNTDTQTTFVGQFILGVNYFLDDFTAVGIDYRLLGSGKINAYGKSLTTNTINLSMSFALDNFYGVKA